MGEGSARKVVTLNLCLVTSGMPHPVCRSGRFSVIVATGPATA